MNMNEVVSNRAHVFNGGTLGRRHNVIHPNDDVNKSQSSNDTFPTGMHIASYKMVVETTIPGVEKLRDTLRRKSQGVYECGKIWSHTFDGCNATNWWQELSGYVSQLDHGLRALRNTLDHLSEVALVARLLERE